MPCWHKALGHSRNGVPRVSSGQAMMERNVSDQIKSTLFFERCLYMTGHTSHWLFHQSKTFRTKIYHRRLYINLKLPHLKHNEFVHNKRYNMSSNLTKWGVSRTLTNDARALKKTIMTSMWRIFNFYISFYFYIITFEPWNCVAWKLMYVYFKYICYF